MPRFALFSPHPSDETPIACDVSALEDPEKHARHAEALFSERKEMRKLDSGYALRFPGTMDYAERILNFVSRERQCCPFLTFEIAFEPEGRGVWLYFGGDAQVASYLTNAFEAHWT